MLPHHRGVQRPADRQRRPGVGEHCHRRRQAALADAAAIVTKLFGGSVIGNSILESLVPVLTTGKIPTLDQAKISGLGTALTNLTNDIAARLTAANFNTFLTNVFGTTTVTSATKLAHDKITGLVADLGSATSNAGTALTNANQALANFTAALTKFGVGSVSAWLDDLFSTKGTANTASGNANTALTDAQSALAGLVNKLGVADYNTFLTNVFGTTSVTSGTTIAQAKVSGLVNELSTVTADIAGALTNVKDLVDGIHKMWTGTVDVGRPVQYAIDGILGIFGVASNANEAAANAIAEIEDFKAQAAAGSSDLFEIPAAGEIGSDWKKHARVTIADKYAPNGQGSAVGIVSGTDIGPVVYVNTGKPVTSSPDMQVTATLSRNPWWGGFPVRVDSNWYLMVQANGTDGASFMVEIANTSCRFLQTPVNPGSTWTQLGSNKTIPANQTGVPYTFRIKGDTLTLDRNGVEVHRHIGVTPLAGRCVGFCGEKVWYVNPADNPLAQFAGISWRPAP